MNASFVFTGTIEAAGVGPEAAGAIREGDFAQQGSHGNREEFFILKEAHKGLWLTIRREMECALGALD